MLQVYSQGQGSSDIVNKDVSVQISNKLLCDTLSSANTNTVDLED